MIPSNKSLYKKICLVVACFSLLQLCEGQQKDTLKIVAFGNSTTAPRNTIQKVYAARLQDTLTALGINAVVINSGQGGSHTGSIKDNNFHKVAHAMDRFDTAVSRYHANWVIVSFGMNDSWQDNGMQGPSRISTDQYRDNLSYFIDQVRKNNGRPILMTTNPTGKKYEQWRYDMLEKYMNITRSVAKNKKVPLVDVWDLFYKNVKNQPGGVDALLLDGMHPNDAGHKIMSDALVKIILSKK